MEILIGLFVSVLTETSKKISDKIGTKLTRWAILGVTFMLSMVGSLLVSNGTITAEMITKFVNIFAIAVGWYEIIYKRIIVPAIGE